jgi:Alginate export
LKKLLSLLLFAAASWTQEALAQSPLAQKPTDELNKELPKWLKFSGEFRARLEGFSGGGFKADNSDAYYLNRIRINLLIQPAHWIKAFAQTQDARVAFKNTKPAAPPYQNTWDLRLAYIELGDSEKGVIGVRTGRQELNFGEQRLVGSLDWVNTARSFDAVRMTVRPLNGVRVDAFASSVVVQTDGAFDHHKAGDDLHGLYGGLEKLVPDAVIEPYVLWRVSPRIKNEGGSIANLSEYTTGLHWVGKLAHGFDYGTEMDIQRGSLGSDQVRAWAGHWVAGYTLATLKYKPHLLVEYNFASGDANAKDGIRATFDQLYPTGHNKYGLLDQVGWKNIKDLRTGVEMKPARLWTTSVIFHNWYLADPHDALYNAASAVVARNPTGVLATHIGEELDVQAGVALSPLMQIAFGYGHLFPGEFIEKATPGKSYNFPYLMFTYAF